MRNQISMLVASLFLVTCFSSSVFAQDNRPSTPIECGQIIESETTPNQPSQDFQIKVSAGTTLNGRVEPIGGTFNPVIWFLDGGGNEFAAFNTNKSGLAEEFTNFDVSTSNPTLRVGGLDINDVVSYTNYAQYDVGANPNSYFRHYGAYTIYLGCTLRDGTVINPGDSNTANATPVPPQSGGDGNFTTNPFAATTPTPVFSGSGFPGLPSVDFANAFTNDLTLGQPAKSKIPPAGDAVLGYTFDAKANDNLSLSFTRASGNLNLGLVVLSADNKVVFQASLITSSELTTKFTLPSDGTYTIGIFRIDLLPPASPEATAFQLTATLNP